MILPTFIRRNIKLAEAPSYGQTIFEYDPDCNGAEDYSKVAKFLLGVEDTPAPEPEPAAADPEPTPELQTDSPAQEPTVATPTESQSDSPAEVPPAGTPQNENPAQVAVVPAPPEPQSEAPAQMPPAAPPIPIVSVNLPAPASTARRRSCPSRRQMRQDPGPQGDAPVAATGVVPRLCESRGQHPQTVGCHAYAA